MKELRLSEEMLLLAINEKKGTIAWYKMPVVNYGVAGAIIRELLEQGKVKLEDDIIKIIDLDPTGDPIIDDALNILDKTKKDKKVHHWISKLSKKEFRTTLFENLLNKGVLRKMHDEELRWSFSKERYTLWFDRPLRQMQKDLHDILIRGKKADEKSLKLIGLAHACNLYGQVFKIREEKITAKEKARELSEEDKIRKGIRSAVNTRRFAVASAVFSIITGVIKEVF